ncbi:hypothetical protein FA13DRAFT_1706181 [Coprinellus micaceus]|uniref:Uncharacterized protein n=1 Tax=Coprinellus micaceus TaxID=71717 RepID=A0A4Y7TS66_COPMI|nr:hypothetical protein FA13DRAFT_1706181 [Coprinellus micaceus]
MDSLLLSIDPNTWTWGTDTHDDWRCLACNTIHKHYHRAGHEVTQIVAGVTLHLSHSIAHPEGMEYSHALLPELPIPFPPGLNLDGFRPADTREEQEIRKAGEFCKDLLLGTDQSEGWLPDQGTEREEGSREKGRRTLDDIIGSDEDWYLWRDRLYCTLNILMYPQSVFSEKQIDLILWLLKVNGITDCPSTKLLTRLRPMNSQDNRSIVHHTTSSRLTPTKQTWTVQQDDLCAPQEGDDRDTLLSPRT